MDALFRVPAPANEPVLGYAPGSPERASLEAELVRIGGEQIELPSTIGGRKIMGGGRAAKVVQPHAHRKVLGTMKLVTPNEAQSAIDAAKAAAPMWRDMPFADRAAILLKAAELLSGPWRATLNAATMLGQSKTAPQAEIDSACELIDFWRINVHFAQQILAEQPPLNSKGVWNRSDYRSLEGFVYAITPFNFTAIGGNLPTAPALMGNTVVWKPARTQQLAAHYTMLILEAAGPASRRDQPGHLRRRNALQRGPGRPGLRRHPLHRLDRVFHSMWEQVGANIGRLQDLPAAGRRDRWQGLRRRPPVGRPDVLRTALVRGAFEFQGQKCSAASRAYVPASLWKRMGKDFTDEVRVAHPG
jgi:1-pyrroline-5-carboxylate dehydrogenase